jgi:RNA polymerase sigma factor (sigma-70 family)
MTAAIRAARMPNRSGFGFPRRSEAGQSIELKKAPKSKVEWADLIRRVGSDGDREAFTRLFEHFAPRIKGFMLKAGCGADEAEEVAQDTLIAVWRKAGQFDPNTTGVAAWIFTIARNLRIDSVRRIARIGPSSQDTELADAPDSAESADIMISRAEDVSRVEAAVGRLSADQSKVIQLSFIEERPHPEIARLLGIPLGTVKSRIRLAMNHLRDLLDEEQ